MIKNTRFKNWAIGTIVSVCLFPLILRWLLSFVNIRSLSYVEAWGIISLLLVLIEGYRLAKLPVDKYGKDDEDG